MDIRELYNQVDDGFYLYAIYQYMMFTIRKKIVKVYFREVIIRLRAFRGFIILLVSFILIGATILSSRLDLPFLFSIYETLALVFFSSSLEYPHNDLFLQMVWILFPITGIALISDGLSSIGKTLKYGDHTTPEWNSAMAKQMKNAVIVIGIGNVGLKLLRELATTEHDVVAIDRKDNSEYDEDLKEFQKENPVPIIPGDATRTNVLEKAGIEDAKALLIVTNDDLVNLKIAMKAKKLAESLGNKDLKLIIRMFDLEFGEEIKDKLGFHEIISTSTIAIPHFIKHITD